MATILDRYGIKEVADVVFYEIDNNGAAGAPVLYLDTLKVSTIEQTAENTSARGGKGNPELIMWDYGKEITVTLEDALFSAKSMALMYGVDPTTSDFNQTLTKLKKTVALNQIENGKVSTQAGEIAIPSDAKYYKADGTAATGKEDAAAVYCTFDLTIENATEITISSDKFPGTYYITGDTYARSETTGKDELFQFIIPKAKMQSEVTLTMEAEGDPSTFSMNLKVLRPASGDMMKLVKYSLPATETNNVDQTGLG
jgi:hypothetical protein